MEKCFIQMRAYNDEKTIKRAIDSVLIFMQIKYR